jgi:predicted NAD-dependent protein-ADP-ribosyltransferase YbiA (DUF1768 family)
MDSYVVVETWFQARTPRNAGRLGRAVYQLSRGGREAVNV